MRINGRPLCKSPAHRLACLSLYRALLRQCTQFSQRLPSTPVISNSVVGLSDTRNGDGRGNRNVLHGLTNHRFHHDRKFQSPQQIHEALSFGRHALSLLVTSNLHSSSSVAESDAGKAALSEIKHILKSSLEFATEEKRIKAHLAKDYTGHIDISNTEDGSEGRSQQETNRIRKQVWRNAYFEKLKDPAFFQRRPESRPVLQRPIPTRELTPFPAEPPHVSPYDMISSSSNNSEQSTDRLPKDSSIKDSKAEEPKLARRRYMPKLKVTQGIPLLKYGPKLPYSLGRALRSMMRKQDTQWRVVEEQRYFEILGEWEDEWDDIISRNTSTSSSTTSSSSFSPFRNTKKRISTFHDNVFDNNHNYGNGTGDEESWAKIPQTIQTDARRYFKDKERVLLDRGKKMWDVVLREKEIALRDKLNRKKKKKKKVGRK